MFVTKQKLLSPRCNMAGFEDKDFYPAVLKARGFLSV